MNKLAFLLISLLAMPLTQATMNSYPADASSPMEDINQTRTVNPDDQDSRDRQDQHDPTPQTLLITLARGDQIKSNNNNITYSTKSPSGDRVVQKLCVQDGETAHIETGYDYPTFIVGTEPYGGVTLDSSQYHSVRSGFMVSPHVIGSQIKLQIKTNQQHANQSNTGQIDVQNLSTTITIPANTWVKIGGSSDASNDQSATISYSTAPKERVDTSVFVNIQFVDDYSSCQ